MTKAEIEAQQKREEWLSRRKSGIGASDSPNILDLTNWGSALSVYLDKIGEGEEFEQTERMEIGLDIEEVIVKIFKKRTKKQVYRIFKEIWNKDHLYLFATPDGRIIGENAGIECKNIGIYKKEEWEEERDGKTIGKIPDKYMIQCQHSMLVTGYDKWYLAALFGGNKFEIREAIRDQELIDIFLPKLYSFWHDNVLNRVPPPAQSNDGSILIGKFPEGVEEEPPLKLGPEAQDLVNQYKNASELEKKYKKQKEEASNRLKQKLGDNKFGWTGDHSLSWSRWDTQRIDSAKLKELYPSAYKECLKVSKSGRLNISEIKEQKND